jgi:hypothetical protein
VVVNIAASDLSRIPSRGDQERILRALGAGRAGRDLTLAIVAGVVSGAVAAAAIYVWRRRGT